MIHDTKLSVAKIRAKDFAPVGQDVFQMDVLNSTRRFLKDVITQGQASTDPKVLYRDVCKAMGVAPERIAT